MGPVPTLQLCSFFSFSDNSECDQATEKPKTAGASRHSSGLSSLKSLLFAPLLSRFLRFYSIFSCVSVSEEAFFFLSLPLLISHSLFCQISSTLCEAFLFTLLYPISPLVFLFFPPFHSQNSAVVEQRLNRNNICCTLPPSWSYSPLTTSLIFSCMQGLVISCGWCRVTFAVWDFKGGAHGYGACPDDVSCDRWFI